MGIRLLVIEDDRDIAMMLERSLGKNGFEVRVATDGQAGIDAFKEGDFDAVLTDWLLPMRDGLAVVEAIRSLPGGDEVGIGLMSGVMSMSGIRETLHPDDARIDAFFDKPFSLSEIRDTMRKICRAQPERDETDEGEAATDDPGTDDDEPVESVPRPFIEENRAVRIEGEREVANILLALSRQVFTGVLTLQLLNSKTRVGFLRGVIVGAQDDRSNNMLGKRLERQGKISAEDLAKIDAEMTRSKMRFAEAALEIGAIDGMVIFEEIEAQARDCLEYVLTRDEAEVAIAIGQEHLKGLTAGAVDLLELLLTWARGITSDVEAQHWFIDNRDEILYAIEEPKAFERALSTFAEAELPSSFALLLPANLAIFGDGMRDVERARAIHVLWLAGMVGMEADRIKAGAMPTHQIENVEGEAAREDRILAARIQTLWVKVRHQDLYSFLEVSQDTSAEAIAAAVDVHASIYGPEALSGRVLGPARKAARELWNMLQRANDTLLVEEKRKQYDRDLKISAEARLGKGDPQEHLEHAKELLAEGQERRAVEILENWAQTKTDDSEFIVHLTFARHRLGVRLMEESREQMDTLMQSMGDDFDAVWMRYLMAVGEEDYEGSQRWLKAAAALNPDHPDVVASLKGVPDTEA